MTNFTWMSLLIGMTRAAVLSKRVWSSFELALSGTFSHHARLFIASEAVSVVDADVDVYNEEQVMWAVCTRFQADTDMFMVPDVFCNRLDPSSRDGMSAKLALDATAPLTWDVVERAVVPPAAIDWATALLARK